MKFFFSMHTLVESPELSDQAFIIPGDLTEADIKGSIRAEQMEERRQRQQKTKEERAKQGQGNGISGVKQNGNKNR